MRIHSFFGEGQREWLAETPSPIFDWNCVIGNSVNHANEWLNKCLHYNIWITGTGGEMQCQLQLFILVIKRTNNKFPWSILNFRTVESEKGNPYCSLPLLSAFQVRQMVVHINIGLGLQLWWLQLYHPYNRDKREEMKSQQEILPPKP